MFSSKKNTVPIAQTSSSSKTSDATIISSNSKFEGTLESTGILRIDGEFRGDINIKGSVIIGEDGIVVANINADKVTIAGKVEGNICCSGSLELVQSGKLTGDIEVKSIRVDEGAIFDGKCKMLKSQIDTKLSSSKRDTESNKKDSSLK